MICLFCVSLFLLHQDRLIIIIVCSMKQIRASTIDKIITASRYYVPISLFSPCLMTTDTLVIRRFNVLIIPVFVIILRVGMFFFSLAIRIKVTASSSFNYGISICLFYFFFLFASFSL